jgi:hypothetical protein
MKRRRAHLSKDVKLAAALVELQRLRLQYVELNAEAKEFYEHSKVMTASQIVSLFHFDHYPIRHADGGPDEPWNLTPLFIRPHREKTSKVDQPGLAKDRRIERKWREFHRAVAKGRKPPRRKSKWPKRKFERRRS